jgi:hypothetical protein
MSNTDTVIRKMVADPANRQMTVTAYSKEDGEVTVVIPTSGMEADALPEAIEHALKQKREADDAANAD